MANYVGFPLGSNFGWGICGRYCTLELARLGETVLLPFVNPAQALPHDPLAAFELQRLLISQSRWERFERRGEVVQLDGPLLVAISGKNMTPSVNGVRGTRTVGYTFFEENVFDAAQIETARREYDVVATGSSWCTEILQNYGLANVATVIQGVDPHVFHPLPNSKALFRDRFVVFSGGKFEFRKGQDVVIRAYQVLQDKYRDVLLVNSWFNPWNGSRDTMAASPLIRFRPSDQPYVAAVNQLLAEHGIDVRRVITLPPQVNAMQAQVYHETDVGLFPNRSEGGTNLVLMEYMACGKPVIATNSTGHRDVVHSQNALVISSPKTVTINSPRGERLAEWPEPNLDETVAHLEWAYHHREQLAALGMNGAREMAARPWSRPAGEFARLLAGG